MSSSRTNKPAQPATAGNDENVKVSSPATAGPSAGETLVVLSPGEDYLTKLLVCPHILKSIASELCLADMRNLSRASKATHRLVEYTCGKPPTQILSRYTCSGSGCSTACWACGINVCLSCANPVFGYLIPSSDAGEKHELVMVQNINGAHGQYCLLCQECLKGSTAKLNEIRRRRMGEEERTYYSIECREQW